MYFTGESACSVNFFALPREGHGHCRFGAIMIRTIVDIMIIIIVIVIAIIIVIIILCKRSCNNISINKQIA